VAEPSEHEAKPAALRAAIDEGETSGSAAPFDFDAFLMRKAEAFVRREQSPR
jgi:antitoxin ParD1/3/4